MYFFVIDVSEAAVASGMIGGLVRAVKASLDELPGNSRTQIGFITFDSHIHFYNLKSTLTAPQMLVVSDVADIIMPSPEDLLVNLQVPLPANPRALCYVLCCSFSFPRRRCLSPP